MPSTTRARPATTTHPTDTDPLTIAIQTHARGLWRYLQLLGCPRSHIEDLCQDTFLVALRAGLGDRDRDQTGAFLRRTATHMWLRQRRKEHTRARLLAAAAERLWKRHCQHDDGSALLDTLRACVRALPDRSRLAIELAYRDGLDREGMGTRLGLAGSGVKSLMQRVRRALRHCVETRIER